MLTNFDSEDLDKLLAATLRPLRPSQRVSGERCTVHNRHGHRGKADVGFPTAYLKARGNLLDTIKVDHQQIFRPLNLVDEQSLLRSARAARV